LRISHTDECLRWDARRSTRAFTALTAAHTRRSFSRWCRWRCRAR
jgi:hypothetical protein